MTTEETAIKITGLDHEIASLKHRVKDCEEQQTALQRLTMSVNKLAINMESMLKEQATQRSEINELKDIPSSEYTYYKRLFIGAVLSAVVGFLAAYLLK